MCLSFLLEMPFDFVLTASVIVLVQSHGVVSFEMPHSGLTSVCVGDYASLSHFLPSGLSPVGDSHNPGLLVLFLVIGVNPFLPASYAEASVVLLLIAPS